MSRDVATLVKIGFVINQGGEFCKITLYGGKLRYGPPESKYHLLVEQFDINKKPEDLDDDAIAQWTFKGIPREFGLLYPDGHGNVGRYRCVIIDNYTGNDASQASNWDTVVVESSPREIPN